MIGAGTSRSPVTDSTVDPLLSILQGDANGGNLQVGTSAEAGGYGLCTRTQRKLELFGRSVELERATQLIESLSDGPAALIVEGDAGIGKTAFFDACIGRAVERGCVVMKARPAEAESALPFAALGDLLAGRGDEVADRLPEPQRRALDVAMLRADPVGAALERRAVSVALLSILRRLAGQSPLLIAIDDLQWIDGPSAASLAYALRRIDDEPVGLLAMRRPLFSGPAIDLFNAFQAGDVQHLRLAALDRQAVRALLVEHDERSIPPATVQRIHRVSGGNPFLALELARAFREVEEGGLDGDVLPIPRDLRELLRARLDRLSPAARRAGLLVAASPHPRLEDIQATLGPNDSGGLDEALSAGILESDEGRLRFTHPLLGSIIYSETTAEQRRSIHALLASISTDPDDHARHLALASAGPDGAVAALLDRSAERALRRGAPDAAAELLERAAALTEPTDANAIHRRLLAGAERYLEAGTTDRARDLFARVERDAVDEVTRKTAGARLGVTCLLAGDVAGARSAFERSMYHEGLGWAAEYRGDSVAAARYARTAVRHAENEDDPAALATALSSLALFEARTGRATALAHIERALALGASDRLRLSRAAPERIYAQILMGQGQVKRAKALLRDVYDSELERGSEGSLAIVLATLSLAEIRAGALDDAGAHAWEGYLSSLGTGQRLQRIFTLATVAHVAALRGHVDETYARVEEARQLISLTDFDPLLGHAGTVLGLLELSRGDPAAAHRALEPFNAHLAERPVRESGWFRFLADEIEALVLLGDVAAAVRALAKLEARRRVLLDRWWASQATLRGRGLIAAAAGDGEASVRHLMSAVRRGERGEEPFELARSLLALGRVQRRLKQRAAARSSLAHADELFAQLGAPLWRERVAVEIRRIGGRAARAPGLTVTETRVAELAAQGLTNREIAAAAFLSVNTVQAYLKRVYREYGVRSRTELARSFDSHPVTKDH